MSKKLIGLTESDLHNIIKKSVNKTLKEAAETEKGQSKFAKAAAMARAKKKYDTADDIDDYAHEKRRSVGDVNGPLSKAYTDAYQNEFSKQQLKMLYKNLVGGSHLHEIVKESVKKMLNEAMNTTGGQFQGGRLAYRKGEEEPVHGKNIAKLRKSPNSPIFNYADKASKNAGLNDYLSNFKSGYNYERDLSDFMNAGDDRNKKIAILIGKILGSDREFMKKFNQVVGDRSLDELTDDELLYIIKNIPLNIRFQK